MTSEQGRARLGVETPSIVTSKTPDERLYSTPQTAGGEDQSQW